MDLERAYRTLGLQPGATPEVVEESWSRLAEELDARVTEASTPAIRGRYTEARAELDLARSTIRAARAKASADQAAPAGEDSVEQAWNTLGLTPEASALDVASAYVSLCEELERDLECAPTEAFRAKCLEARAELDEAYRRCAAAPLHTENGGRSAAPEVANGDGEPRYETQMSQAPFEVAPPASQTSDAEPDEGLARAPIALTRATEGPEDDDATEPVATLTSLTDDDPDDGAMQERFQVGRAPLPRRSGRSLRAAVFAAGLLVTLVVGVVIYAYSSGTGLAQHVARLTRNDAQQAAFVEAQSAAEYLRQRLTEEHRELERQSDEARQRLHELGLRLAGEVPEEQRERVEAELAQAQVRDRLVSDLVQLTERHVFSSGELVEAYGKIELAGELARTGDVTRAREVLAESRTRLEELLLRLDQAEEALGARIEAATARDAWHTLAATLDVEETESLEEAESADEGEQTYARGEALLARGAFQEAANELRRSVQSYRVAVDEARELLAATRAREEEERAEVESEALPAVAAAPPSAPIIPVAVQLENVAARAAVKLVVVPAGPFVYGCEASADPDCGSDESPAREIDLPAFRIDRTEVRVAEYARCTDGGVCSEPRMGRDCNWDRSGRDDHPINCVDWDQAHAYCRWVGKRLPTELEWEKAARGVDGRRYPWGDEGASCDRVVMSGPGGSGCGMGATAAVASLERGRSPYGLFDMSGNLAEWTFDPDGAGLRVVRGGSWRDSAVDLRSARREGLPAEARDPGVGFRCAQGASLAQTGTP